MLLYLSVHITSRFMDEKFKFQTSEKICINCERHKRTDGVDVVWYERGHEFNIKRQVESDAMGKCVYLKQLNVYNNNNTSEHVNLHNWLIFVCEIFVMRGSGDSWGKGKV